MIRLGVLLMGCIFAGVYGGGSPIRNYAYSYATPDGQSRYEVLNRGALRGAYQYRTPEGAVVAVRYSNDEHAFRATGDNYLRHYYLPGAYRRLHSYTTGGLPVTTRYFLPKNRYAFSYATPDGQARYEHYKDGAVKGGYSYRTPEGGVVAVRYSADEDGFRTKGDQYIYHGTKPGSLKKTYSHTYSGFPLSRPVIRVQPHETVIPSVKYVRPVSYYYGYPGSYWGSRGRYFGFPYSVRSRERYTLPVNLKTKYNSARIEYEPVEAHGYTISF